jgi:hypothetical protein
MVWAAPKANVEERPEASNAAAEARVMVGELAMEPEPVKAKVPAETVVLPV